MDFIANFFHVIGAFILDLVEQVSGLKADPRWGTVTGVGAAIGAAFTAWKALRTARRFFGGGKALTADETVLVDAFADRVRATGRATTSTRPRRCTPAP